MIRAKLRPFEEGDYPYLISLMNQWQPTPVTLESVRDRDQRFPPEGVLRRQVLETPDHYIVGYSEASHVPHRPPGEWWTTVTVEEGYRREGLGSWLLDDVRGFVRERSGTVMCDYLRENDSGAVAFAEKLGAKRVEHIFDGVIDPRTFDESPYLPLVEGLRAEGIRFFTFAETEQDDAAQQKLHDLYSAAEADMPHALPECRRSFDDFVRGFLNAWWWDPTGFFIAADGDHWIGLVGIAVVKDNVAYNEQSGVLSGWRGRGIATALKVLGLVWCRERGVATLRTSNHDGNEAMLAINRKLGYKPEPGWLRYDLSLENANG